MSISSKQIDALLPQTQCGLCGFKGCMPYAEALAKKEATINLCPPGGVPGLLTLAKLVNEDPSPYIQEMEAKAKPNKRAIIREAECIGCTKCIQACPVDAIVGAGKLMHTVIQDECTGCELCIAPCPVDCIDMVEKPEPNNDFLRNQFRNRFLARQRRLEKQQQISDFNQAEKNKKKYILEAIQRVKQKKSSLTNL